jgi:hypothetical protein
MVLHESLHGGHQGPAFLGSEATEEVVVVGVGHRRQQATRRAW